MLAGHLAVALALKPVEKRLNLGLLVFAAFFADFLLGILVLLGVEQVHVPEDFSSLHYLTFTFPYSHGLVSNLLWAALAFGLVKVLWKQPGSTKAGLVMAAAVFSHFILDWLVHIPELPVLGTASPLLGLGLWRTDLNLALGLETGLVVVGTLVYLATAGGLSPARRYGLIGVVGLVTALTITGQTQAATPPPAFGAASTWILESLLLAGLAYWLDGNPE